MALAAHFGHFERWQRVGGRIVTLHSKECPEPQNDAGLKLCSSVRRCNSTHEKASVSMQKIMHV